MLRYREVISTRPMRSMETRPPILGMCTINTMVTILRKVNNKDSNSATSDRKKEYEFMVIDISAYHTNHKFLWWT